MTHDQAVKKRDAALREAQLDLYHTLQERLNEIAGEMLGNKAWDTEKVDRSLTDLLEALDEHFGIEEA